MYDVVTREVDELDWDDFDRGFYEIKEASGRASDPVPDAINTVSCFGDNAAEEQNGMVPVNENGTLATRDQPEFEWSYVCPTHERYRTGLLKIVDEAVAVSDDVRLDDVCFPREGFCRCDRCEKRFGESEFETWSRWREHVITEFVADARRRVPGRLSLGVYPDPFPGHLSRRNGIAIDRLEAYVDEFVVPIYDASYTTTYWLEILASAFDDLLSTPLGIELYAVDVEMDDLVDAAEVAGEYADNVLFGYDAGNARAVARRVRAQEREGKSYRPE